MEPEAQTLANGFLFEDRYEILGELGSGGFSRVYLARQRSTGQSVAVKLLTHREGASHEVERFHRETEICAALSHPNIVRLIDSGETTTGQLYAVFEHVPGETLAQALEREGALGVREAVRLMTQVLEALADAHAKGIVHRDLKPENLMLSSGGARRSALVLDFGLGAVAAELRRKKWETLTQDGEFLGTPLYAAPEQLTGEPATPRSDLFSWGLIFLECLTGRHPFAEKGAAARLLAGGGEVAIPGWLADHRLGELLTTVTEREPSEREVTAAELINVLEQIAADALLFAPDRPAESQPCVKKIAEPVHPFRPRREADAAAAPTQVSQGPRSRWKVLRRRRLPATLGLVAVLVAGAASWSYSVYEDMTTTYSIAVLPFTNLSADEETGFFATGLAESILDQLVQREGRAIRQYGQLGFPIGKLDVASSTASLQAGDRGVDLSATAEKLNVAYVLEGSVQRLGDRLHVTSQLIRAEDGFHVWSKPYDRAFADRFEIRAGVARNVAHVGASELLADILDRYVFWGALGFDTSTEAMRYFRKADNQYRRMFLGEGGDWSMHEQLLRRAVEADPNFCLAYESLAHAYMERLGESMPFAEASEAAHAAIGRALELHPEAANVQLQLGQIYMNLDLDYAKAEASFRRGLDRFPENIWFHAQLGSIAMREGRTKEALRRFTTASILDARHEQSLFLNWYAWHLLVAGEYEQALMTATAGLDLASVGPTRVLGLQLQVVALNMLGRTEEARPIVAEAWDLDGSANPEAYIVLFARAGEKERARSILAGARSDRVPASAFVALGDTDSAFKALEAEIEDRSRATIISLRVAEWWDEIRDDPRFDDMLELLDSKETHTEKYLKQYTDWMLVPNKQLDWIR